MADTRYRKAFAFLDLYSALADHDCALREEILKAGKSAVEEAIVSRSLLGDIMANRANVPRGTGESFREMRLRVLRGEWPEELLPIFDGFLDAGVYSSSMVEEFFDKAKAAPDEVDDDLVEKLGEAEDKNLDLENEIGDKEDEIADLGRKIVKLEKRLEELLHSPCQEHENVISVLKMRLQEIAQIAMNRPILVPDHHRG